MDYGYSDNSAAGAAIVFLIFAIVYGFAILVAIAIYVVTAFAFMAFFRKVGIKPWIAWVPFYNTWVWLEVGGQPGWLSLLQLIPYGGIATSVFIGISSYRTGIAFRKEGGYVVLAILLPFVWAFLLGSKQTVYQPELITAAGYPPPHAGYGSDRPNYATVDFQAPPA